MFNPTSRTGISSICLTAAIFAGPFPSSGQQVERGPSILTLLDHADRVLILESETGGVLDAADIRSSADQHLQAWAFNALRGQTVTIDLKSEEFDAYLYLIGPGLPNTLSDDDGAGACNARITVAFPATGVYRVVVSSLSAGATGAFRLHAREEPGPEAIGDCGSFGPDLETFRTLSTGDRRLAARMDIPGALTATDVTDESGSHVQAWSIEGEIGRSITIDLLSDAFDAFLYVIGPGITGALSDDDGAGACNARITFAFPETATYKVIVSSIGADADGAFTLRASDQPPPVSEESCHVMGDLDPIDSLPLAGRAIEMGVSITGALSTEDLVYGNGSHVQAWGLHGEQGRSYTIDLQSDAFDSYLYVAGPGLGTTLSDDDGGGACHSRLTFVAPQSAIYHIVASTIGSGQTGAFRLAVMEMPGPTDPRGCGG